MALLGTVLGQNPERIAAVHSLQPFARPSLPIPLGRPLELGDGPPSRPGAAPVQLRVLLQAR